MEGFDVTKMPRQDPDSNLEPSRFTVIDDSNCPPAETADDYCNDPYVSNFLDFLKALLTGTSSFRHSYQHADEGYEWQCRNLLDAARRYSYPVADRFRHLTGLIDFRSLPANTLVLQRLKDQLRSALLAAPPREIDARDSSTDILHWGGTEIRGAHNLAAVDALGQLPGGLIGYIELCRRSFGSGKLLDLSPFKHSGYGLRSNSGFTKIYSLAFDDFVIYDSRVAAALGLIVVRWWALTGNHHTAPLPATLRFLCMPANGESRRNPNENCFHITGFPFSLSGAAKHIRHLQCNVRTNWLLKRALVGSHFANEVTQRPHPYPVEPLRALEAALFMIGYDLAGNWPHTE
jgi:hypothetical protein